ncbi:NAD(P)-dependent oxidoreductase [Mycobacterium ahvazicum]|uniref:NAD(P)-dependent oxidoreductase n=1 Tax=Mycobacterium ahvazicum TaxID=1964395 RepID=A0A2K4YAR3_9MYCO|nr:NAD(P)-dependent oxidoreductase [Mycobacterium ahvazicum]
MANLSGRVALVTGAGRGTGRPHCERFAEEGADAIALDAGDNGVQALQSRAVNSGCAVVDAGLLAKA